MKRILMLCAMVSGCNLLQRDPPPPPQVRVDTVTVTQTIEPPLPEGRPIEVCLATGVTAQLLVAANGDTLVGERRIPINQLRPVVGWAGSYAQDREWFRMGDVVTFERLDYRRAGVERERVCDELKLVGEHQGVPIFAEVTAPQILPLIVIPVRPGIFQDYLRVTR